MTRSRTAKGTILACLIAALLVGPAALAQRATPSGQTGQAASPIIDQRAIDLLKSMSSTLGAAREFTYQTRSAVEVPAKTGQFITLFATSEVAVKRPDRVRVNATGEIPNFDFYYDGRTVSAFSPTENIYSTTSAPNTIDAMLPFIEEKTEIQFPSADVMYSDPYAMMTKDMKSAIVVGPAMVQGVPCQHLAFTGQGINWEIWIATGVKPLPMRLAATYADVQNFPRFLVEFSDWNLQPTLNDRYFAFQKPANAKEVQFGSRMARRGSTTGMGGEG